MALLAIDDPPNRKELLEMLEWAEEAWMPPENEEGKSVSDDAAINTDDLPLLEFHTTRNRFRKFRPAD